jgi:phosphoribosylanthranilate isomerase
MVAFRSYITCCSIGTFCSKHRSNIKLVKNRFCDENEFVFEKVGESFVQHHTSNEGFQTLRFEQVQENDTRKTSNEVFQTLRFEKNKENNTRKTSNVSFQTLLFEKNTAK